MASGYLTPHMPKAHGVLSRTLIMLASEILKLHVRLRKVTPIAPGCAPKGSSTQ